MIPIVRLEQDHRVARVQQRQACAIKCPGRAGTHNDFRLRVSLNTVIVTNLASYRRAQRRKTIKTG